MSDSLPACSPSQPPLLRLVLAFLAVYVIWGSTYLAIAVAIQTLPIFLMAGVRFVSAGLVLYVWARRRGAKAPTRFQWRHAAIVGAALLWYSNGSVVWAETRVPSGLTALLIAVVPLCMVLLEWAMPNGRRPTRLTAAGLFMGLAGVGILTGPSEFAGGSRVDPLGAAALVVASFVWSAGSLYSRGAAAPDSPYLGAAMQMISGGCLHLVTGTVLGEWGSLDLAAVSPQSALSLLYLAIFGSIIGFTAYSWLLRVTSAARVATYAYVNPVVAVFLGWLVLNEPLNQRTFAATAIIVAAVVCITRAKTRGEPPSEPVPAIASSAIRR